MKIAQALCPERLKISEVVASRISAVYAAKTVEDTSRRDLLSRFLTWDDVWALSERARIPTVMTFGKHKGVAIEDVPGDYKRWLLGRPDIDPYLTKALKAEAA